MRTATETGIQNGKRPDEACLAGLRPLCPRVSEGAFKRHVVSRVIAVPPPTESNLLMFAAARVPFCDSSLNERASETTNATTCNCCREALFDAKNKVFSCEYSPSRN